MPYRDVVVMADGPDKDAERYYRRLVAYYITEARRWHRVALRSPEVQAAYKVLR